jgi:IS5 family transposase
MGFESQIHQRAYCNHHLSQEQKQVNQDKSKTRVRVEHVFGNWVMQVGAKLVRSVGLMRAKASLVLKNLTYNFVRYTFLQIQSAC